MGIYDNASKRVGGGGAFLKLKSGKNRMRILELPIVSSRIFRAGQAPKTLFAWPVYSYDEQKVCVLQKGASIFNQIGDIVAEYGEELPMACDLVINVKGSGLETQYSVVAAPVKSQLPKDYLNDMPQMDKLIKNGITLKDFSDGKDPATTTADDAHDYAGDDSPPPSDADAPPEFGEEDAVDQQ